MDRHFVPAHLPTPHEFGDRATSPPPSPDIHVPESRSAEPDGRCRPSDVFSIALFGEVDIARTRELVELVAAFRRSAAPHVDVDLAGVEFMDSTGLMAMTRLRAIAQQRGGAVRLVRPTRSVRRILDVSGFDALCEIVTS